MKLSLRLAPVLCLLGLVWAGGDAVRAQDVTGGKLRWVAEESVPDELSRPAHWLVPDYPAEMKAGSEIGYVTVTRDLDATGRHHLSAVKGTNVRFQRAVEAEILGWEWTAARQAGRPVASIVWMSWIFNPKSTSPDLAEATPRLLEVSPVFVPRPIVPSEQISVLRVVFSLDEKGAVTGVKPETEQSAENMAVLRSRLQEWRFAPARKDGQPRRSEVTMPVICEVRMPGVTPPRIIKRVDVDYPRVVVGTFFGARVIVNFEVDTEGRPENVIIESSNNPLFDVSTIEAVRQWRFKPALQDGRPITVKQRSAVGIGVYGEKSGIFGLDEPSDQTKLHPELRYDTAPEIIGMIAPIYPYELRRDHVTGLARATILIGRQGEVTEVKITQTDRPEFGLALAAALEGYRFDPALNRGQPVPNYLSFEQKFGFEHLPDVEADRLIKLEKQSPDKIVQARALDRPLRPLSRQPALFPLSAPPEVAGEVMIECLVDRRGRVRAPRVISASHPAFGYAAVQAVSAWWFEPPQVGGAPIAVRVRVPFKFVPPTSLPPAKK